MALKNITIRIDHYMQLEIPDELLEKGAEEELDAYIYDMFVDDPDWYFSNLDIQDV